MNKLYFIAILSLLLVGPVVSEDNKVKLVDVQAITLRTGELTTGRRSSPLQQLVCQGTCTNSPTTVQCKNMGTDGHDVQWECTADLNEGVSFDIMEVNCEGYDYPDDPYVLVGSCQLRYTLKGVGYTSNYRSGYDTMPLVGFGILLFLIGLCVMNTGRSRGGYRSNHGYGPHYHTGSSGPGFLSGAAAGALGGYAYGRHSGRRRWGSYSRPSSLSSRSSSRRSTGFASTTRR